MKIYITLSLLFTLSGVASAQTKASSVAFKKLVNKTYNFDVSRLSMPQMMAKEKTLDQFWKKVKANKQQFLPCLREEIKNPKANKFFRYDGVNLLMSIEPSANSKRLLIDVYTATDLNIVGPERWLDTMAQLGTEGFDISKGALRWMSDPKAHYTLPAHGDYGVNNFAGALFLFGSMSEAKTTPILIKIVNNLKNPQREAALSILMDQATPESFKAIDALDPATFSPQFQQIIENYRTHPTRIVPRENPLTTREQFLQAFQELVQGKPSRFQALAEKVDDGEKDVVAVMRTEDLPLLRKVRRAYSARANPHALDYYNTFTDIITTLMQIEPAQTQPVT